MTAAERKTLAHAAEADAAALPASRATSLSTLLASHVLRDGEIVLMILKPSLWFILFSSLWFAAIVAALALGLALFDAHVRSQIYLEPALFLIAGRLMWAVLQWMGRLYILTDMRVLRLAGVFTVEVFDCPLRQVVRTRLVSTTREKIVRTGSIEIIPRDQDMPAAVWQTVAQPQKVHERLLAAINRARQCGGAGGE